MKTIIGIVVSWALALVVAWAIFFKAAPALCALIPASVGAWKGFVDVAIYLVIAGLGGVGLIGTRIAIELD